MSAEQAHRPIAAVLVHVPDVPAGLDWYEHALPGARRVRLPPPAGMEVLDVGGVMVEVVPADEKVGSGAAGSVVYWRAGDFDAELRRLLALGARLVRGPGDIEHGQRMCQLRDPWGNCLGLRGPAASRPGAARAAAGPAFEDAAVTEDDRLALTQLEEAMWREDTRFDMAFMERALAPDFFEFGRSGRTYTRAQTLAMPRHRIDAVLPLPNLRIRMLGADTAQVTYDSAVIDDGVVGHGHRSSIWSRTAAGWVMRFHQGTPFDP